jgi:polysaccharide pyruvyl transferase WcaK-like protein
MIIGGGGLLSHPHDPLTDEEWQRTIDVPVVLFGIGAGGEVASKCHTLISKAAYVSGRDESSVAALERFRNDVHFVPDPVLADFHYYLNDVNNSRHRVAPVNKLWILKNAKSATSTELMQMVNHEQDEICFIEPFLDFPLLDTYPAARSIYFIKELTTLIDRAAMIISMRYHGCILAILRDKPILGLVEQKSRELLTRYNLSQFFSGDGTTIPNPVEFTRPVDKIVRERDLFRRELGSVLSLVSMVAPTEIATSVEMV